MQFVSSANNYFATSQQVSPEQSVNFIQTQITPVITWATDWGIAAGYGLLGVALFYQVVIILVKPDK